MTEQLSLNTDKIIGQVESDGIAWLIFNNPDRHNALSLEMWQGISNLLEHCAGDNRVKVVIMKGAGGKSFVSGADISEFDDKRASSDQKGQYNQITGAANHWLSHFSKPLLAAIDGYCIGGGLATALAADIRFATPHSTFGIPAARLGLGYDYEGLAKLARIVGPSRARDIMMSARFFHAEEAQAMGLVNFVVPAEELESSVREYANRIAQNAPLTVAAAKAAVDAYEGGGAADQIEMARKLINACFDSEDYKEGRRAFKEKRQPTFVGR